MSGSLPVQRRRVRCRRPVGLELTLGGLRLGAGRDPCLRIGADGVWRATRTAQGPATVHLASVTATEVEARAWGPGAVAALDAVDGLIGADDDPSPLDPPHPLLSDLNRRLSGLRLGRTGAVFDALVIAILSQKVLGLEAGRAWVAMVRAAGRRAPGPAQLWLPPEPAWLSTVPSWAFHRWGVEHRRAVAIRTAAGYAHRLEEAGRQGVNETRDCLARLPGVGPWTVNEVAMTALGDPDAVSVGDYWLKHIVAWALAGEPRATDERMLELLEPWAGQRGRVCRLIMAGGPRPPRFGPRLDVQDIARL